MSLTQSQSGHQIGEYFTGDRLLEAVTQPNLCYPTFSSSTNLEVLGGLWNCQSAVKKADTISAFPALTETRITPENTATPAVLSPGYPFSQSLRQTG